MTDHISQFIYSIANRAVSTAELMFMLIGGIYYEPFNLGSIPGNGNFT